MKKLLILMMALIMTLSLAACGGEDSAAPAQSSSSGAEFVSMTFGDITMSVPNNFSTVTENQGIYVSAGPDASITVTPSMEIDLLPSEWDESLAEESLELLYGSTYTDMELAAFEGNVNMNGNTAVYLGFYGTNADGKERMVQVVRIFNADQTEQYQIVLMHSAEDEFFTPEVGGKIINSITLVD